MHTKTKLITAQEIVDIHKSKYSSPEDKSHKCAYCSFIFYTWHGYCKQHKGHCCKHCLDAMLKSFENDPLYIINKFASGFRKKTDAKRWNKLDIKDKIKYIRTIIENGVAIYVPV